MACAYACWSVKARRLSGGWRAGALLLLAIGLALLSLARAQPMPPDEVVRSTAELVMGEIRERGEEMSKNPDRLYLLVEQEVVPRFDVPLIARLVLGQFWGQATPGQRERFATAFQYLLVRTYAKALLVYKDDPFEWYPLRLPAEMDDVLVRSTIAHGNEPPMAVNYRLHSRNGRWLVYDVSIDGISLVTNYRGAFTHDIRKYGLEAVIERLEKRISS